ncbi:MAG: DNA recombination protein RmuC [Alistipes sp.]|nr:DNA recombination protein RmuC [Alistipes sp.]
MSVVAYIVGRRNGNSRDELIRIEQLEQQLAEARNNLALREERIEQQRDEIKSLTAERDVQRATAEALQRRIEEERAAAKEASESQQKRLKESFDQQLATLREMNKQQVENQLSLIKEQMRSTSEEVLKARQKELGERNVEQVSKIVNPLEESIKLMREALNDTKEKHQEAMHRLDATIQANMKNSETLGETAARLTRALTGEVKVQGNFGELKLKQLLEDLGLKDGEQYSSQEHLRDKLGKRIKDDEERGLIPDFVLHFPNNRDVVVDSKMSFTAYERYINSEDAAEQSIALKEHLRSVRAQVERLAKKDYSKYLQEGYNKLNFVIMYIHTEGALNLALLNDTALWREAYDRGVLILGPQTMYMNLRILELMWTQVRQLHNQEEMMRAANQIIDRTQDFAARFAEVETKMHDTVSSINKLKITTAEEGKSIITAARNLIKAGARENRKKRSIADQDDVMFLDAESTTLIQEPVANHSNDDAEQEA